MYKDIECPGVHGGPADRGVQLRRPNENTYLALRHQENRSINTVQGHRVQTENNCIHKNPNTIFFSPFRLFFHFAGIFLLFPITFYQYFLWGGGGTNLFCQYIMLVYFCLKGLVTVNTT